MALLSRARQMGELLEADACCPACLLQLAKDFSADATALDQARHDIHKLWDRCAWALSFPELSPFWIKDMSEKRRSKAERARGECALHSSDSPTSSSDILHDFMEAVCACLHVCLSLGETSAVQRSAKRKRAFENKGRYWPWHREILWPYGEQPGVQSVLFWCEKMSSPYPIFLLGDMLRIAHPLVMFEIQQSPKQHGRLLIAIFNRLADYAENAVSALSDEEGPPQDLVDNMEASVSLLSSVCNSPDALPNSLIVFAKDSEAGMFKGLELALVALDQYEGLEPWAHTVASLCAALYHYVPTPDASKMLCPHILNFVKTCDTLSLFGVLHRALKIMARNRRICSGPDCTTVAHHTDYDGDAHFLVCARCQLSRYCSKECQLADWKRGSEAPHKSVCPRLCKMLAVAKVDMKPAEFEAAVGILDWDKADQRILSLFALNLRLLPVEIVVRAGDIYRMLLDGEELSDAAIIALASVDGIKRDLQELQNAAPIF